MRPPLYPSTIFAKTPNLANHIWPSQILAKKYCSHNAVKLWLMVIHGQGLTGTWSIGYNLPSAGSSACIGAFNAISCQWTVHRQDRTSVIGHLFDVQSSQIWLRFLIPIQGSICSVEKSYDRTQNGVESLWRVVRLRIQSNCSTSGIDLRATNERYVYGEELTSVRVAIHIP